MNDIPAEVLQMAQRGPAWAEWVKALAGERRDVLAQWQLTPDGDATHGFCSLVIPVRTAEGQEAMLKLAFPDEESEHEALALAQWEGAAAVRLLTADPHRRALLLERLEPRDLGELWDIEACQIVGGLYGSLHRPASPQHRRLTACVDRWTAELAALPRSAPLPRRLVDQAVSLGRSFVADAESDGTLIHSDLHYANVMARAGNWVAIDPKPLSGDPHYEIAPMLWNRLHELSGRMRDGIRQRFFTLVDAADLDEERARDWVVVRMLHNALWRLQDPPGARRLIATDDWLTICVSVAKAVQE